MGRAGGIFSRIAWCLVLAALGGALWAGGANWPHG
jgi:hypothetical protein